jgi:hypothetical protein
LWKNASVLIAVNVQDQRMKRERNFHHCAIV